MVPLKEISPEPVALELRLEFSAGTVDPPVGVVVAGDVRVGFAGWLEMLQAVAHLFNTLRGGDSEAPREQGGSM